MKEQKKHLSKAELKLKLSSFKHGTIGATKLAHQIHVSKTLIKDALNDKKPFKRVTSEIRKRIEHLPLTEGEKIVLELKKRNITQAYIANQLDVCHTAVTRVIHGHSKSKRISDYINFLIN